MGATNNAQVLVVGAGPVGSVAAYLLANQGLRVMALEAGATSAADLRASTFHPPTLEMLDQLGITATLIDQGLKAPVYQYRDRRTADIFEFDLTELSDVTPFPYRLQCEQFKLARLLAGLLEDTENAEIQFSRRVVHITQDNKGVTVHAESPYAIEEYRADYVIAADGSNSIVRKWLDVDFAGFTYPEKFLTLSTAWPLEQHFHNLSYVNYIADPDEWLVLLRVPELWRVLVPVDESLDDDYILSDEKTRKVFDSIVGADDGDKLQTEHRTIYRVHQRVVNKYNHGRIILIGDAAHLNNPLGGMGMNSGIHDAWNLCDKLVQIIRHGAEAAPLLDRFDRQRRTVMHKYIQEQTIQNKAAMELSSEEQQRLQREQMQRTCEDEQLRRAFMLRQAMITGIAEAAAID